MNLFRRIKKNDGAPKVNTKDVYETLSSAFESTDTIEGITDTANDNDDEYIPEFEESDESESFPSLINEAATECEKKLAEHIVERLEQRQQNESKAPPRHRLVHRESFDPKEVGGQVLAPAPPANRSSHRPNDSHHKRGRARGVMVHRNSMDSDDARSEEESAKTRDQSLDSSSRHSVSCHRHHDSHHKSSRAAVRHNSMDSDEVRSEKLCEQSERKEDHSLDSSSRHSTTSYHRHLKSARAIVHRNSMDSDDTTSSETSQVVEKPAKTQHAATRYSKNKDDSLNSSSSHSSSRHLTTHHSKKTDTSLDSSSRHSTSHHSKKKRDLSLHSSSPHSTTKNHSKKKDHSLDSSSRHSTTHHHSKKKDHSLNSSSCRSGPSSRSSSLSPKHHSEGTHGRDSSPTKATHSRDSSPILSTGCDPEQQHNQRSVIVEPPQLPLKQVSSPPPVLADLTHLPVSSFPADFDDDPRMMHHTEQNVMHVAHDSKKHSFYQLALANTSSEL